MQGGVFDERLPGVPEATCPYKPPDVCGIGGATPLVSHVIFIADMLLLSLFFY